MGSSLLQSLVITRLVVAISQKLSTSHYIFTNELGLQFSKGNWRAADIAIYEKSQIDIKKVTNKYTKIPPKVVIEIDTKADIEDIKDTFNYYNKKTDQLLEFGVERVVWIFTDSKKILIASHKQDWTLINWSKEIQIFENFTINIAKLVEAA